MGEPIAEVGYLAGICGNDDGAWVKVAVNAEGRLEIVLPLEEALGARAYHYTGSAWVRSNLLWGYHDRFAESKLDTNAPAGVATLTFTAVPPGSVYALKGIAAKNQDRAAAYLVFWVTDGTDYIILYDGLQIAAAHFDFVSADIPMKEGDYVIVEFYGTIAGDDIYASIWGYEMKIDM